MVQIFWATLGLKPGAWTTSVFMIEMMLMTMLLTVPDPPTHSKLEAAHCSLTFLANHPAQCCPVFCPTQCCPPVLPTVLHSVAHPTQSIIRKLFSKSITGNVSKSQYWFQSCHFEIASQPSQAVTISFRSIRFQFNRIIRQEPVCLSKNLCVFPQQVFPVYF